MDFSIRSAGVMETKWPSRYINNVFSLPPVTNVIAPYENKKSRQDYNNCLGFFCWTYRIRFFHGSSAWTEVHRTSNPS